MLYSSLTPSLANNSAHNLLRNLGSRSVISFPGRLQSIKFKRLRKTCAYCFADQVFASSIKVTHFENLHVTDIIALKSYFFSRRARTKSSVGMKKGTGGNSIGCRDL